MGASQKNIAYTYQPVSGTLHNKIDSHGSRTDGRSVFPSNWRS